MADKNYTWATGRRKTSVARVRIKNGKGAILVNGRELKEYFPQANLQIVVMQPFDVTSGLGKYDVFVNVKGGGVSGQAGAVRHGIARALQMLDPDCRKALKVNGYLTRDSRMVERKKYGQPGARKKFQFSKR